MKTRVWMVWVDTRLKWHHFGLCICPKSCQIFTGMAKWRNGEWMCLEIRPVMRAPVEEEEQEKAKRQRLTEEDRNYNKLRPNWEMLILLCAQIQSLGMDPNSFIPSNRCKALKAFEVREFVKQKCPVTGEDRERSVIKNTQTKKKRYLPSASVGHLLKGNT